MDIYFLSDCRINEIVNIINFVKVLTDLFLRRDLEQFTDAVCLLITYVLPSTYSKENDSHIRFGSELDRVVLRLVLTVH